MSVDEAFNHRREATPNSQFSCCLLGIQAGAEHIGVYLKYYMEVLSTFYGVLEINGCLIVCR